MKKYIETIYQSYVSNVHEGIANELERLKDGHVVIYNDDKDIIEKDVYINVEEINKYREINMFIKVQYIEDGGVVYRHCIVYVYK
jgi:hypothetical protein